MRNDMLCVIKYNNIFAAYAQTIYVLCLLSACIPLSGINKPMNLQPL